MPAFGFWCSCGKPSVWPISCTAVSISSGRRVRSQPKFMVRWLPPMLSTPRPIYDQAPSPRMKPMRISASSRVLDLLELEPDADVLPDAEGLAHHVLLGVAGGPRPPLARAVREEHPLAVGLLIEEVVVQHGAVRPLVARASGSDSPDRAARWDRMSAPAPAAPSSRNISSRRDLASRPPLSLAPLRRLRWHGKQPLDPLVMVAYARREDDARGNS